jgi:hypothetical protein
MTLLPRRMAGDQAGLAEACSSPPRHGAAGDAGDLEGSPALAAVLPGAAGHRPVLSQLRKRCGSGAAASPTAPTPRLAAARAGSYCATGMVLLRHRQGYWSADDGVPQPGSSHAVCCWHPMLGLCVGQDANKKTLVLDLDETLVHSSFKPIPDPDYIIPVEIEGKVQYCLRKESA